MLLPRVSRAQHAPNPGGRTPLTTPATKLSNDDSATAHTFVNHNPRAQLAQLAQMKSKRTSMGSYGESESSSIISGTPTAAAVTPTAVAGPAATAAVPVAGHSRRGSPVFSPGRGTQPPQQLGIQGPPAALRQGSVITYGAPTINGGGEGFGIEGVRTGEEVVVSEVDKRQPRKADMSDPNRDDRRLRALQGEVKALSEKLKKSQSARLRQKLVTNLMLAEMEARRELELAHCLDNHDRFSWELANNVARAAHSSLTSSRQTFEKEVNALQSRITEFRAALDEERERTDAATKAEAEARKAAEDVRAREVRSELDRTKAELEEQTIRFAREKAQLETALAEAQEKLRQSDEAKRRCTEKIAEDMFLVAQCRLFVKNVCQPGFNVVKGVGLEPVDKERREPTGFVLVPLVVLLHGYTLLPAEDRKAVIDHYETTAASATAPMTSS